LAAVSASTSLLSLPNVLISSSLNRNILMRWLARRILSHLTFSALYSASERVNSACAAASISARSEPDSPSHSVLLMPSVRFELGSWKPG
jgi:hypothetical protein